MVRTAQDGSSLIRELDRAEPDVILLKLAAFDSHGLVRTAHEHGPRSRLIVLGASEADEGEVVTWAEAGAVGYTCARIASQAA